VSLYRCRSCGHGETKWFGRCAGCGAWGSVEETAGAPRPRAAGAAPRAAVAFPDLPVVETARRTTGITEFDRVLGGGLVPGAVALVGGEPGIGKSTLLLQSAAAMCEAGSRVVYASAEESAAQLRLRGERLGVRSARLLVLAETDVDAIVDVAAGAGADALVVDSVQALRCPDVASTPGSVAQVREAAARLVALAKSSGVPVLLVGHVTKDGALAGPRVLEHMVDTVLQFEGDRRLAHRILRALKNRFGSVDELAVFSMAEGGLAAVESPSEIFLAERPEGAAGSAVHAGLEGTRPILLEIQALVGEPVQGSPRRTAQGIEPVRLAMLLAVLERRAGLPLAAREVYVNVTGGVRVDEPAADLAVAAAVASSYLGRPLPERWVFLGEIGLTGEVRSVPRLDARLREAARLGFTVCVAPPQAVAPTPTIRVVRARDIGEALRAALGPEGVGA
jgi:DNA repair protein RadA/Sms